jgi:hypothetical protein
MRYRVLCREINIRHTTRIVPAHNGKGTTMKTLSFGVEIETVGRSKEVVARAIQGVVGGSVRGYADNWEVCDRRGRTWAAVPDGSLSVGANAEVVTPILAYDDIAELREVVRALAAAGCRANESCGIHIHVDCRGMGAKAMTNLVKLVFKQERLIEVALGIRPYRLQEYCKPIDIGFLARLERAKPRDLRQLNAAWYGTYTEYPGRRHSSRYHALNLNSFYYRGTTEFRYFEGSVDPDRIKAYIQFVLALVATAKELKSASSRRRSYNAATSKYDFRCWLLRLGLIGPEFKTTRKHLLANLGGSAAWKGARRDAGAPTSSGQAPPAAA